MLRLVMQLKIHFFKHKDRREREKKRGAFLATQEHQKKSLPGLLQNEKPCWFKHQENTPRAGPSGAIVQDTECSIHEKNIRGMFSLTIQSLSHVLLGKQNSYGQDNTEETPYKISPQLCNAASSSPVSLTKRNSGEQGYQILNYSKR